MIRSYIVFVIAIIFYFFCGRESYAQCNCTVSVVGDNVPSVAVINGSVICISGNRSVDLDLQNATNTTICIEDGSVVSGAFINLSNPITINNYGILGTGAVPHTLTLGAGSVFNNTGLFFGSFTANGGAKIFNSGTMNANGSLNGAGSVFENTGSLTGNLTLGNGAQVNNDGSLLINILTLSAGGILYNSIEASISVTTSNVIEGDLINDGFINFINNVTLANGRTLINKGTISALNFTNHGTVESQEGTINIGRDFTNSATGVYNIGSSNIGRNLVNAGNINIYGSLSVVGTLNNNLSGQISAGSDTQPSYLSVGGDITNSGCLNGINHTLYVNKFPRNYPSCSNGEVYYGGNPSCPHIIEIPHQLEGGYQYFQKVYIFSCSMDWTVPVAPNNGEELLMDDAQVLIIGGGGGGGRGSSAGGGGAGAVNFIPSKNLNPEDVIPIRIGVGGGGSSNLNSRGSNGVKSSFGADEASGGGGGGSNANDTNAAHRNGMSGGSGGGGAYEPSLGDGTGGTIGNGEGEQSAGAPGLKHVNTTGKDPITMYLGGGGGGSNGAGEPGSQSGNQGRGVSRGGNGGPGYPDPILMNGIFYAGGGGGTSNTGQGNSFGGKGGSDVGGAGNVTGRGLDGITAGSGGGAGRDRGGNGAKGLVMVTQSFRILPVKFIHFTSLFQPDTRVSKLSWSTSKEWENSHFEIERSIDGSKTFVKIGQVSGMGWTDEITEYNFEDDRLPLTGGNIFYRLRQVDFNGRFDFSDITAVRVPNVHLTKGVWRAYPNPIEGSDFNIELVDTSKYNDEPISLRILSTNISTDEMVFSSLQELNRSAASLMANAPVGLWIVELQWGNNVERIKVIKR